MNTSDYFIVGGLAVAVIFTAMDLFGRHESTLSLVTFPLLVAVGFKTGILTIAGLCIWLAIGFLWSLVCWRRLCERWKYFAPRSDTGWRSLSVMQFPEEMLPALLLWPVSIARQFDVRGAVASLNPYAKVRDQVFADRKNPES